MAQLALKDMVLQQQLAAAGLYPTGDIVFVDSGAGNDGNNGKQRRHAVATLARAIAIAEAGDLIVCEPGGSEAITTSLALAAASVKVFCPNRNAESGYTISGPGTLDLMTVSAADCHIEGLRFTRDAGAGTAVAGVLTTAAAHRLTVKKCSFDYSDLTSSFTSNGIELTDSITDVRIEDCVFRDCHRGVISDVATGEAAIGLKVLRCEFWVGQATAFGIYSIPAGTGTLRGVLIDSCVFLEADGDGSAATDAWDGSDNTDATVGPIRYAASVDQGLVSNCRAQNVLARAFNVINGVTAGAEVEFASSSTGTGTDSSAAVTSVGSQVDSVGTLTISVGAADSVAASTGVVAATADSTASSVAVSERTVNATADSTAFSIGVSERTVNAAADSVGFSTGVVAATADSTASSVAVSERTVNATADSVGFSTGVVAATADSTASSVAVSERTVNATADSVGFSVAVSERTVNATADSVGFSVAVSERAVNATDVQAIGRPVGVAGSLASDAVDNNTQGAGNTIATAAGDVMVEEVLIAMNGVAFTGPTNLELTSDNVYGLTGNNAPHFLEAIASLQANENIAGTTASGTAMVPFLLESGKKLYLHGDNGAGAAGALMRYTVIGRAMSVGGSLS